jgi:tRNA (guanine37-N1)-methyltransferase
MTFKIDIITLFPDMFKGPFDMSMMYKAQEKGLATINYFDPRTYGIGPRRSVDDTPYGGGDGMVLRCEPIIAAIEAALTSSPSPRERTKVVLLTPSGLLFKQATAQDLVSYEHLIFVAGHYEGFDERVLSYIDLELSIGDYVLTGGELPAMVITDAIVRLIPGVLGGEQSAHDESFTDAQLLEYPHYTRPADFRGAQVPKLLQNGNHGEIAAWRLAQAKEKTRKNRPDLLS